MSTRARAAALAIGLAGAGVLAGTAAAQHEMHTANAATTVSAAFASFSPSHVDILTGERVMWRNDSARAHTVVADDASFASARIPGGGDYEHRYDSPGTFAYHCTLHSGMTGEVAVHRLLLAAPVEPGAPGRLYTLSGRTSLEAGTDVAVQADAGAGFADVADATVGLDGAIEVDVRPAATTRYRLVAGADESPPVTLLVLDRSVAASATTSGHRATVRAHVTPASPGATVVLQLYLPRRFGWWPVSRARVRRDGTAVLHATVRTRVRARVVLTLADGATVLARSREVQVGRPRA